jgi:hypothetical protein
MVQVDGKGERRLEIDGRRDAPKEETAGKRKAPGADDNYIEDLLRVRRRIGTRWRAAFMSEVEAPTP